MEKLGMVLKGKWDTRDFILGMISLIDSYLPLSAASINHPVNCKVSSLLELCETGLLIVGRIFGPLYMLYVMGLSVMSN